MTSSPLSFLRAAESLKKIRRTGWIEAGIKKPESVADHSFACTILAMIFGDIKHLDTCRMVRMALLHDLHESLTGDMTPRRKRNLGKHKNLLEDKAIERILSGLPRTLKRKYGRLILEYENQTTQEANLVRELDKLEMALQAFEYQHQRYTAGAFCHLLRFARAAVRDRDLRHLLSTAKRFVRVKQSPVRFRRDSSAVP